MITLSIMITFNEILDNYPFDKLRQSIDIIDYKFDKICIIIDTYHDTSIHISDKENCLIKIKSFLNLFDTSSEYHVIDYHNPEYYDRYLYPIFKQKHMLLNRHKMFKNGLIYIISMCMCDTKYLFHIDCNKLLEPRNQSLNLIDQSIEHLRTHHNVMCICTPPKKTKHIIKYETENFYKLSTTKKPNRNHFSLQSFFIDIERYNNYLYQNLHKYASLFTHTINKHKQIENIFDKCLHEHNIDVLFLDEKYSNFVRCPKEELQQIY